MKEAARNSLQKLDAPSKLEQIHIKYYSYAGRLERADH